MVQFKWFTENNKNSVDCGKINELHVVHMASHVT